MPEIMSLLGNTNDDLYTEIIKENLERRILVLNDEINEAVVENYILYILKWNREDKDIPVEKRQAIILYNNSPGGHVFDGESLISAILTSKTPIKGVAFGLVASMGYRIFLACHERIAFKNSVLLQHDGDIAIQNSTSKARETMKFFESMEERTKQFVLSRTKMTEEFYDKIYNQEYYMYADTTGRELGIVDKIIGEDCALDEIL